MRSPGPWSFLTHEYLPFTGGIATYVHELARALSEAGESVEVWTAGQKGTTSSPFPVFRSGGKISPGWPHSLYFQFWLRFHRQEMAGHRLILGSYGALQAGLVLSPFWQKSGCRIFPLFHGSEILKISRHADLLRSYRLWLQNLSPVLAASPEAARQLVSSGLVSSNDRIRVIPCALPEDFRRDPPQARAWRTDQEPFRVLTLARVHPRKGQLDTAKALGLLPPELRSRALYQIAGPAQEGYLPKVLEACRSAGVACEYLGVISPDQIRNTYAQAHLYVLSSRTLPDSVEGFGLTYLEAAACGLPAVAYDSGGAADAVVHGQTGLVVPEGDTSALSGAIARLLQHPDEREKLGQQARLRALGLTWENSARLLIQAAQTSD
jgi:glycosyltransferase involved in cell wall biosynthesis